MVRKPRQRTAGTLRLQPGDPQIGCAAGFLSRTNPGSNRVGGLSTRRMAYARPLVIDSAAPASGVECHLPGSQYSCRTVLQYDQRNQSRSGGAGGSTTHYGSQPTTNGFNAFEPEYPRGVWGADLRPSAEFDRIDPSALSGKCSVHF